MTLLEDEGPASSVPGLGIRLAELLGVSDVGRALRDFSNYLPAQAVQAVSGAIVLPVLARRLSPTDLGVLILAQTLVIFGTMLSSAWLTAAVVREFPVHRDAGTLRAFESTLVRALGLAAGLAALFVGVLAVGAELSAAIRSNFPYIVGGTFAVALHSVGIRLLASGLRSRASAFFDGLARIANTGIGVGLVFAGYGVHGYMFALTISYSVVGLVSLWVAWPRAGRREDHGRAPRSELPAWVHYGIPAGISAVLVWGLFLIDRYLLAVLKDTGTVGLYTVGNVIGEKAVSIPAAAFTAATGPLLVTAFVKGGRDHAERLLAAYTRIVLLLGLGTTAAVAVTARPVVRLLAGSAYSAAWPVSPIVAAGSLLYALGLLAYSGLVMARNLRPIAYATGIGLLANVVANLALIPTLGIKGAAIATPIGMGAFLAMGYHWSRAHLTWHFPFATLGRGAVAAAVGGGAAAVVVAHLSSQALEIVVGLTVFAVGYVGVLAALGERSAGRRLEAA